MSENKATYMFIFRGSRYMRDMSPEQMQQSFEKWMAWIVSMKAKGQYLAGEPLEHTPAQVLRGPRGQEVTDGPYTEAKEIVGGYMLIAAASFEEAVTISRDCPGYDNGGCVEVRLVRPIPV